MDNTTELKYRGLLERVGSMAMRYENEISNLRVELTEALNQINELKNVSEKSEESNV